MTTKHITPHMKNSKNLSIHSEDEYPFVTFLQEMNRTMDRFFHGFDLTTRQESSGAFMPKIDVLDTEKEITITAELPGMEQKDVDIALTTELK